MLGVGRAGPRRDPSSLLAPRESVTGPAESGTRVPGPDSLERDAWAILLSVSGLGPVTFAALLERFGTGRVVVETARGPRGALALAAAIAASPGGRLVQLGPNLLDRIVAAVSAGDALLDRVRTLDLSIVTLEDAAYPGRLRSIEMPPPILFVRGDLAALSLRNAVAVVGTRRPSDGGRRIAARIAGAIARCGGAVVSGLAVGIDGAAHAAAVAEAGRTVGVLGGGHGRIYPRAHARLVDAIVAEGGVVLSELPPDTEPTPGTFPRRNRLISGLSDATVVVEAGARSGALITASWALEQGRACFLVPGSIDAPTSSGCLAFLREWAGEARIVAGIPELLEDLGLAADPPTGAAAMSQPGRGGSGAGVFAELGSTERRIAEALVEGRATADELVAATALPVATVLGALTLLEMRGLVTGAYGRYRPAGRLATIEPGPGRRRRVTPRPSGRATVRPFAASAEGVLP